MNINEALVQIEWQTLSFPFSPIYANSPRVVGGAERGAMLRSRKYLFRNSTFAAGEERLLLGTFGVLTLKRGLWVVE
jgi:hypothetical protein